MSPVAERELRTAARNPKTYQSRRLTALLVLAASLLTFWLIDRAGGNLFTGLDIFKGLSTALLVFYVFAGATWTADCLSEEKREGTLGLLFLTDLKGYDIVLGKLLSTSLKAFYGFLAAFPVLAITLTLGGIRLSEFWKVVLNLSVSLLLALSIGLFVSSVNRQSRRAFSAASSALFILLFVFPAASELLRRNGFALELAFLLQFLSPLNTHLMAFEASSALRNNFFWLSFLTTILLALSFLGLASFCLPRFWQDPAFGGERTSGKGWRSLWQQIKLGSKSSRVALRQSRLDQNPFYWLASRDRFGTLSLWIVLVVVSATVTAVWLRYSVSDRDFAVVICSMGGMIAALALLLNFTSIACQRLADDRQSGTLELLLSTPLSVRTIVRGQWKALTRKFVGPLAAVILLNAAIFRVAKLEASSSQEWIALIGAGILMVSMIALGWTGMWMALRVHQAAHASGAAFWRIMLLPWPFVVVVLQTFFSAMTTPYLEAHFPYLVAATVVGIPVLNSLFWSIWCRARLYREFRIAATERFQPAQPSRSWWHVGGWLAFARDQSPARPLNSRNAAL